MGEVHYLGEDIHPVNGVVEFLDYKSGDSFVVERYQVKLHHVGGGRYAGWDSRQNRLVVK